MVEPAATLHPLATIAGMAEIMQADADTLAAELRIPPLKALRLKLGVTTVLAGLVHGDA